MTIEKKIELLNIFCNEMGDCDNCPLRSLGYCNKYNWKSMTENQIEECFKSAFYSKEEINHPDRYASGQFECIDIMIDVYGKEAVKHFCILNAFKYVWRAEKKNGVEDIKKAVWYLNKYIELGGYE